MSRYGSPHIWGRNGYEGYFNHKKITGHSRTHKNEECHREYQMKFSSLTFRDGNGEG